MIEWFVERLISLLGPIENAVKDRRELADNALRALSHALTETSLYLNGPGKKRNREIEEMLAKYWAAAAIPLRHIDPEFAERCQYKSEYWINPEYWNAESSHKQVVKLSEVSSKLRELLHS